MFEQQNTIQSRAVFPATDWALIDATVTEEGADAAHERFCELYWYPVCAFIRRKCRAMSPDDVLEATQEFFTLRLEKRDLVAARQFDGPFRQWIMGAVWNLVLRRCDRDRAQKRDRRKLAFIDGMTAEARVRLEPQTKLDPLRFFEHDLALGVLERALTRLQSEYAARREALFFERAAPLLVPGEGEVTYAELEQKWGLPKETLKVRVHTMRRGLARLVRRELGLPDDGDIEAASVHLEWLFQALDTSDPDPKARLLSPEAEKELRSKIHGEDAGSWKSKPATVEAPA